MPPSVVALRLSPLAINVAEAGHSVGPLRQHSTALFAKASAVIYSLIETAKANGLEPYHWLRQVLRELPAAKTVEAIEVLLPWNVKAALSTKPMTETIVELEAQV